MLSLPQPRSRIMEDVATAPSAFGISGGTGSPSPLPTNKRSAAALDTGSAVLYTSVSCEETSPHEIQVDEDADVWRILLALIGNELPELRPLSIGRGIALAIDKYDMQLLRHAVAAACRRQASTEKLTNDSLPLFAFNAAAHLDDRETMIVCLRAKNYTAPATWQTSISAELPFHVFCALPRAWQKEGSWNGMIDKFIGELESAGSKAA